MISNEEIKGIKEKIYEYNIDIKDLYIKTNNGKFIIGAKLKDNRMDKIYKLNHFLLSVIDLNKKTIVSIELAIGSIKRITKEFDMLNNHNETEEIESYYYLENAIYRIGMLWDSLAQIYNVYIDKGFDINKIYYKSFFKNLNDENNKIINIKQIYTYIIEEEKTNELDIGVHSYVNKMRNTLTHRYSLAITAFSDNAPGGIFLKPHYVYLLYKISYDFNKVMKFLSEIFELIEKDNKQLIKDYSEDLNVIYRS